MVKLRRIKPAPWRTVLLDPHRITMTHPLSECGRRIYLPVMLKLLTCDASNYLPLMLQSDQAVTRLKLLVGILAAG
jgi:hypothetical protein